MLVRKRKEIQEVSLPKLKMKVLLVNNGSRYLTNLKALLKDHSLKVISYEDIPFYNVKSFDLIILSGGHRYNVVNHPDTYKNEINLIRTLKKPIIGICLGFELIAYAFNAKLKQLKRKKKGVVSLDITKDDAMFAGLTLIKVFEKHRWVVDRLHSPLMALARSKDGIEILRHKRKPIYGMQFHPEVFVDKLEGSKIFYRLLNRINTG